MFICLKKNISEKSAEDRTLEFLAYRLDIEYNPNKIRKHKINYNSKNYK